MSAPLSDYTVVIIGSNGMLARDVKMSLEKDGCNVSGFDLPDIDITSRESIAACIAKTPGANLLINCAAYTAVDKAESEPGPAFAVNRDGPGNLAAACRSAGIPMIHISTDYVFDGKKTGAYLEDDRPNPLSVYGKSKQEGEAAVRSELPEHLIVRTAWMYGLGGNNFVKTMLRLAREREELRIVADQFGCPTWSRDLATAIARLAGFLASNRNRAEWGAYHFCGAGRTNWFEFTKAIVEQGRKYETLKVREIHPITTSEYPVPAPRPGNSVLDCGKIARTFGIEPPPWRNSLEQMMRELMQAG